MNLEYLWLQEFFTGFVFGVSFTIFSGFALYYIFDPEFIAEDEIRKGG